MTARQRLEAWATGHPIDLAVFRVTVAVVVLGSVDVWDAQRWALAAVRAPLGWGLVSAWLPPTVGAARLATAVVIAAAALTLVGLWTRWAAVLGALTLTWLLAVPQHSGQVLHTHHLAWFFALVASGPSGDALSLDAWRRRHRGGPPGPSLAHGLPLRAAWLSVGLVFFFPGLWKLLAGPAWLEALPRLVEWKRFQLGFEAPVPLSSGALRAGGALAVLAELCLGPLLWWRRTRALGVAAALTFHLGVQLVMGIAFSSLWVCYLMFGDWARWLGRSAPAPAVAEWRSARPSLAVGALLLGAMVVTGLTGREDTWPVACYPTFRSPAPQVVSWVEIEALDAAGRWVPVLTLDAIRNRGSQRWWGLSARAAATPTDAVLEQLHRQWAGASSLPPSRYVVASWSPGAPEPVRREVLVRPSPLAP